MNLVYSISGVWTMFEPEAPNQSSAFSLPLKQKKSELNLLLKNLNEFNVKRKSISLVEKAATSVYSTYPNSEISPLIPQSANPFLYPLNNPHIGFYSTYIKHFENENHHEELKEFLSEISLDEIKNHHVKMKFYEHLFGLLKPDDLIENESNSILRENFHDFLLLLTQYGGKSAHALVDKIYTISSHQKNIYLFKIISELEKIQIYETILEILLSLSDTEGINRTEYFIRYVLEIYTHKEDHQWIAKKFCALLERFAMHYPRKMLNLSLAFPEITKSDDSFKALKLSYIS